MSALPLSTQELMTQAPALFTEQPHHEASDKYHFIPTIEEIGNMRVFFRFSNVELFHSCIAQNFCQRINYVLGRE